jgi:hypothetical protein
MIVLAARPGVGKTAFALNIALNAALGIGDPNGKPHPVAIFSLEMGYMELVERLICSQAEIDSRELRKGNYMPQKLQRDIEPIYPGPHLHRRHFRLEHPGAARPLQAAFQPTEAGRQVAGPDRDRLLAADGSAHRKGGGGDNRQAEVAQISRGLKTLAKELHCPVLALSQLSREPAKGDSRPRLHHLRESGAIEQDADIVAFLHPDMEEEGKVWLYIDKHRAGSTADIPLSFRKQFTRYYEYTTREEPSMATKLPSPVLFLESVGELSVRAVKRLVNFLLDVLATIGGVFVMCGRIIALFPKALKNPGEVMKQAMHLGVSSMPLIFVTSLFVGMVAAVSAKYQFRNVVPLKYLGTSVTKMVLLELGPVITALVMSGRIGSSIAAQIATMKEKEEIDAMVVLDLNPLRYLAAPRILVGFFAMPVLTAISCFLSIVAPGASACWVWESPATRSCPAHACFSRPTTSSSAKSRASCSAC